MKDKNPHIEELCLNVITQEFTNCSLKAVRLADRINKWHQEKVKALQDRIEQLENTAPSGRDGEQLPMPNFGDDFEHVDTEIVHGKEIKTPALFEVPKRPTKGIAVDVGCSGNPGKAEYRGVDLETGKCVFHVQIPGLSTNNIGEFLAAVRGLIHSEGKGPDYKVWSDSMTAIAWVRQKHCKTKHHIGNSEQANMIKTAETYLLKFGGKVHFWSNREFGEIPADLSGRKGVKK